MPKPKKTSPAPTARMMDKNDDADPCDMAELVMSELKRRSRHLSGDEFIEFCEDLSSRLDAEADAKRDEIARDEAPETDE